jgi:GT2 family glycosyltransferase
MDNVKIANIVICYQNEDEVVEYAKTLKKQDVFDDVLLIIVINKIGIKGIEYLKNRLISLDTMFEIINPGKNLGYLNGLLYGYKQSKKKNNIEWFVLSNTDIDIHSDNFISSFLKRKYLSNKKVWMVGPSIYAPLQKKYSNPYIISRPSKYYYYKRIFGMSFPSMYHGLFCVKKKFSKNNTNGNIRKENIVPLYAIHGSYMFVRDKLLDILIERDKWELLYNEEQYLAEVTKANDKEVLFDSGLEVNHMEGTSTGKINIRKRYSMMKKSNQRIIREFY